MLIGKASGIICGTPLPTNIGRGHGSVCALAKNIKYKHLAQGKPTFLVLPFVSANSTMLQILNEKNVQMIKWLLAIHELFLPLYNLR